MGRILDEIQIRDRNVITIPIQVREILDLHPGDFIRWELNDSGSVIICKVVFRKVSNIPNKK